MCHFAKPTRIQRLQDDDDGDKKPWNKLFQESITTNSIDHLKINSIHMKASLTETETESDFEAELELEQELKPKLEELRGTEPRQGAAEG